MNQRNRQPFTRPADRAQVPSAVRVIGPKDNRSTPSPSPRPIVARPEQLDGLPEVVDHLRAGHAVLLQLDGLVDGTVRRRGLAFVSGAACALGITVARSGTHGEAILLDPSAPSGERLDNAESAMPDVARPTGRETVPNVAAPADTCVLCDLRTADREFPPPLEMVIKRDGSRIWSPPAMVCLHCRETIRHWKFSLAWCSECERWGRRNVVSPCGQLYD